MTIDKLLDMSADELDKLTEEQKELYFKPYLVITHPDHLIDKPEPRQTKRTIGPDKVDLANDLFAKFGIDFKIKK